MKKEQEILTLEGIIIVIMFLNLCLLGFYFYKQEFLKDCIWAFPIIGVGCIYSLFLLDRRNRLIHNINKPKVNIRKEAVK